MPSARETLPTARTRAHPAVGFSGAELLDFLAGQAQAETLRPGDVTIGRLAERIGRSEATAKRILAREIRAGHLVRVRCVNEMGRMEYAYRPAKDGPGD